MTEQKFKSTMHNKAKICDIACGARIFLAHLKATLKLNDTLDSENSKKITKAIKDSKIKVSAQIRGEEIRVTSKSIDDLQECIKLVRGLNLELPISFKNLK